MKVSELPSSAVNSMDGLATLSIAPSAMLLQHRMCWEQPHSRFHSITLGYKHKKARLALVLKAPSVKAVRNANNPEEAGRGRGEVQTSSSLRSIGHGQMDRQNDGQTFELVRGDRDQEACPETMSGTDTRRTAHCTLPAHHEDSGPMLLIIMARQNGGGGV